jgi:very-short-patch-repair endonuclease
LFRSLFRGREDVYPRRFESRKTGKAGYAPACANEWVRGVCEKPKVKCAECPHRRFLPVTDEEVRWHLSGRDDLGRDFVMGIYPMLLDETCLFLAVDFDKESWEQDAGAFVDTCRILDVPAALERSRSGHGAHAWFFFAEAVSASLPVSWRGTVAQYVGRLHRLHGGKREVRVYDYADLNVKMFANMFDRRCRGYESLGYTVLLPASALPGWPVEVPLPIEPEWKQNYAASVRRLIRDGVDAPLANLFVHASKQPFVAGATKGCRDPAPDAEGAARARSASEAFLYRRLETLAETTGQFRLNTELPIPFDNRGLMEVDFLCREARVVIELDGAQHLADADAYRRDRRKDALLQQHGYFVLRFLAEDAGKQLDHVLDAILAALAHRSPTRP